jgi:DNA repair protein RadC
MLATEETAVYRIKHKGSAALTNRDLIELILGIRLPVENIMSEFGHNLKEISKLAIEDLEKRKLTKLQAARFRAIFELSRRVASFDLNNKEKIAGSRDVFELMHQYMQGEQYERFFAILLNRANRVLRVMEISNGGISGTVADPKKIFKMALDQNASSIILCHNHPSGNIQPSETDIKLTRKLKDAGLLLDLPVLDHIIYGDNIYFSFADEGMV